MEVPINIPNNQHGPGMVEFVTKDLMQMDRELESVDATLAPIITRYREHKRRRNLLAGFAASPVETVKEIVMAHGAAVRYEGESMEVGRETDLYSDPWVTDAILKYLATPPTVPQAPPKGGGPN